MMTTKKITILFFLFLVQAINVQAQLGWWTWMHGSNTPISVTANGNLGTMGVASPTNDPPRAYNGAEWTDLNGNFWMFGGATPSPDVLWKFDPTTNMWTWIKGSSTPNSPGIYGTMGTPAPANMPGARVHWGVFSWVDKVGDLWMFGGMGNGSTNAQGYLNDLWRYNIASNQWTWMNGSNAATPFPGGSYGTQGVAASTNVPPCRREGCSAWTDNNGNLWLFGGESALGAIGLSNDLWKYDIVTNMWTWMRGSNLTGAPGNYGTKGVAAPSNDPSARRSYTHWVDNAGDLWLFGGDDITNIYNDLWKYNIATNMWTWVRGSNLPNPPATYGTKCVSNINDDPPARTQNKTVWKDKCGNFWMFGGRNNSGSNFNDLWHFDVPTTTWTWVSGNGPTPSHGTMTVAAASNMPEPRSNSMPFTEKNGNLWMFGGNYPPLENNDMWRYIIDTNCVNWCALPQVVTANFTSNVQSGCASLTVNFTNTSSINATFWNWNFGDGNVDSIANPSNTYASAGTYTVILIASNGTVSDTTTNTITVYPQAIAAYTASNDTLCLGQSVTFNNTSSNSGSSSWNFGDGNVSTSTSPTHTYAADGNYSVTLIAQNINGCNDTITSNVFVTGAAVTTGNPLTLNCNTPSGTISVSSTTPNVIYSWSGPGIVSGDSTSSPLVNVAGIYTVVVIDPITGCTNSSTALVINTPASIANVSPDISIALGANTTLTASGGASYNWFPATGLNSAIGSLVIASPIVTTMYCVEVTDSNGCTDTACVTVSIELPCPSSDRLNIPNAFSPNTDNINDDFCLLGWDTCIEDFKIFIYNRWGEKVFESKDPNFCWDGKSKGITMDAQVFVYYIKAKYSNSTKAIIKKGNISLLR